MTFGNSTVAGLRRRFLRLVERARAAVAK